MRAELPSASRLASRGGPAGTYLQRLATESRGRRRAVRLHDGRVREQRTCTWGRSQRVLKDALVKIHLLDGEYADFVPGWTCTACRSSARTLGALQARFPSPDPIELRRACRERAFLARSASASRMLRMGTGFGRFGRSVHDDRAGLRGDDRRDARRSGEETTSTRDCARRCGASTRPRWPRPRSSTKTIRRRRSTCLFAPRMRSARHCSNALGSTTTERRCRCDLDDDALDAPRQRSRIAFKPEAIYGVYRAGGEDVIFARDLAAPVIVRLRRVPLRCARGRRSGARKARRAASVPRSRLDAGDGRLRRVGNGPAR